MVDERENTRRGIDDAVADFAIHMKHKLLLTRHRAHWKALSVEALCSRMEEEVKELREAIKGGDRKAVVLEAADVANFAMMIADNEQWAGTRDWRSHEGR
jgi:NTP pyrophosphatase (non-canonical NTP hydrolase)